MPHVIVKLYAGKLEQRKARIADEVTKTGNGEASVSVSIEDIAPKDWAEKVYKPDIVGRPETFYKEPGYGLADLK
jgi:4-oxalocrotonate tautomerase